MGRLGRDSWRDFGLPTKAVEGPGEKRMREQREKREQRMKGQRQRRRDLARAQ